MDSETILSQFPLILGDHFCKAESKCQLCNCLVKITLYHRQIYGKTKFTAFSIFPSLVKSSSQLAFDMTPFSWVFFSQLEHDERKTHENFKLCFLALAGSVYSNATMETSEQFV